MRHKDCMNNQYYRPSDNRGFQLEKRTAYDNGIGKGKAQITGKVNDDLVIEENTIYEIDRECTARARKQRKKR